MESLVKWIRSKVGCGYVYGATGWICTQRRLEEQAAQYPEQAKNILTICPKWIGVQCFDCAQLIRQGLKEVGINIPSGVTSQWNADIWKEKGEISRLPETLCVLFKKRDGVWRHNGWYLGGGVTVDARGSSPGVIASTVDQFPWTHYAIPKGLKDEEETPQPLPALYEAMVVTQRDPLRIREAPVNGAILGAAPKGAVVEVLTEPQSGWCLIRYGSVTGYASAEYLRRIEGEEGAPENPPEEGADDGLTRLVRADGTSIALEGRWRVE